MTAGQNWFQSDLLKGGGMSASANNHLVTRAVPPTVVARKGQTPLVCASVHHRCRGWLIHCDIVLIGDSVGVIITCLHAASRST